MSHVIVLFILLVDETLYIECLFAWTNILALVILEAMLILLHSVPHPHLEF